MLSNRPNGSGRKRNNPCICLFCSFLPCEQSVSFQPDKCAASCYLYEIHSIILPFSDRWFFHSIILFSNPDPLKSQSLTTTITGTNPLLIATLKNRSKQTHADMHSRAPEDNTSTISDDEIGFRPNFWTKKERIHSSVTADEARGEPKRKKKKKKLAAHLGEVLYVI